MLLGRAGCGTCLAWPGWRHCWRRGSWRPGSTGPGVGFAVIAALFVCAAVLRPPEAGDAAATVIDQITGTGKPDGRGCSTSRSWGTLTLKTTNPAGQRTVVLSMRGVEMSVVPRKVIRQELMQTAVLDKIERDHLPVDTDQVRQNLDRIREQVRGKSLLEHVERWEHLLRTGDLDLIRQVVLSDDEVGREMRNLSPLTVLLTESERLEVLDNLRHRAA